jgi:hypothetical protein
MQFAVEAFGTFGEDGVAEPGGVDRRGQPGQEDGGEVEALGAFVGADLDGVDGSPAYVVSGTAGIRQSASSRLRVALRLPVRRAPHDRDVPDMPFLPATA